MILQGPNEAADTDAEIERIKSEIELEQKNKQTLGGKILLDNQSDYQGHIFSNEPQKEGMRLIF